jgi:hypothetical protein
MGMGFALLLRMIAEWAEAKEQIAKAVDGNDMLPANPNPEVAYDYTQREARRVERPAYERSVPGIVVREVDIDLAHKVVNAKPGSIVQLGRAE